MVPAFSLLKTVSAVAWSATTMTPTQSRVNADGVGRVVLEDRGVREVGAPGQEQLLDAPGRRPQWTGCQPGSPARTSLPVRAFPAESTHVGVPPMAESCWIWDLMAPSSVAS